MATAVLRPSSSTPTVRMASKGRSNSDAGLYNSCPHLVNPNADTLATTAGSGLWGTSPRSKVKASLDAPMSNPLYLSDAPDFFTRQRKRAAKSLVSEHVPTITCPCQKCTEAAKARATLEDWPPKPSLSRKGNSSMTPGALSTISLASSNVLTERPVTAPERLSVPLEATQKLQEYDFVWLLKVAAECAGSGEVAHPKAERDGDQSPGRFDAAAFFCPTLLPGTLEAELGVAIPDTVVLEKGKPLKRYVMDAQGKLSVMKMRTSAELLRVLRDFVKKALRPRLPPPSVRREMSMTKRKSAAAGASKRHSALGSCASEGSLPHVQSLHDTSAEHERTPQSWLPSAAIARHHGSGPGQEPRHVGHLGPVSNPNMAPLMMEVAVLVYSDGGSRLMTCAEALQQMKGASRLPRDFWQPVRLLQVPVQSAQMGVPTRYIIYNYDSQGNGVLPQEPADAVHSPGYLLHPRVEAQRVAEVPKKLNAFLASRPNGKAMQLVSGQFEFVYDTAVGALWLVNASKLKACRLTNRSAEAADTQEEPLVRFFEEEDFDSQLKEQMQRMDQLRKRFSNKEDGPKCGAGVANIVVSEGDQLAGVKVPENLVKFYEVEQKMHKHYNDEVLRRAMSDNNWLDPGVKAVGLQAWFRRWQRACRRSSRQPIRRDNSSVASPRLGDGSQT